MIVNNFRLSALDQMLTTDPISLMNRTNNSGFHIGGMQPVYCSAFDIVAQLGMFEEQLIISTHSPITFDQPTY